MNIVSFIRQSARRFLRPNLHRPEIALPMTVFGTEYGGWPLVDGLVGPTSVVYSVGVGEDISFDLAIIEAFKCMVWAFDPTPKAVQWIGRQQLPQNFHFLPIGLAAIDGKAKFFAPANSDFVSFSSAPPSRTGQIAVPILGEVRRLSSIMQELGHSKINVLKMDIEGFEYDVIDDILSGSARPEHLLVEFHHGLYGIAPRRTRHAVAKLRLAGYSLFYVSPSGHEYGFVRDV